LILNACDPVFAGVAESATCSVKLFSPGVTAAEIVPVILHLEALPGSTPALRPVGNAPVMTLQPVSVPVPPLVVIRMVYVRPAIPSSKAGRVMLNVVPPPPGGMGNPPGRPLEFSAQPPRLNANTRVKRAPVPGDFMAGFRKVRRTVPK
jgi:hypothetical protein